MKMNFEKIELKQRVMVPCMKCKKKAQRVISDYQTINPFNKDSKGNLKTRDQIMSEVKKHLREKVDAALKEGRLCNKCLYRCAP